MISWGTENDEDYWLIANSLGKILVKLAIVKMCYGIDECNIGEIVIAGEPLVEWKYSQNYQKGFSLFLPLFHFMVSLYNSQSNVWVSTSEPADTMLPVQSLKREGGDYCMAITFFGCLTHSLFPTSQNMKWDKLFRVPVNQTHLQMLDCFDVFGENCFNQINVACSDSNVCKPLTNTRRM